MTTMNLARGSTPRPAAPAGRARPGPQPNPDPVHQLLAKAALHYRQALQGAAAAQAYLHRRGVGYAVAQRFEIGYARRAWRDLGPILHGFRQDEVQASGLVIQHRDGRAEWGFDRFRDRLIFPIRRRDGQVAGFGARTLDDRDATQAKYTNSPEGPCFRKRELLYGLHEAQEAIRRRGFAVVMEGYLDVLLSVQAGLDVAVGSLGTCVTASQVEQLLDLAPRVVFCFDADEAGRRAAQRALHVVAPLAHAARTFEFAVLPSGHDPASLLQAVGLQAMVGAMRQATPFEVFATQCALEGCDLAIAEGRARCAAQLGQTWRLMAPSAVRAQLVSICSALLSQPEEAVIRLWRREGP